MRYLAIIIVCLLCAVSLESQISPGALHRLIGNPSAVGGGADSPTNWVSLVGLYPPTTLYKIDQTTPAAVGDPVGRWGDTSGGGHDFYFIINARTVYITNLAGGSGGSNYCQVSLDDAGNPPKIYTNNISGNTNYTISALMQFFPTAVFNNTRTEFGVTNSVVLNYVPNNSLSTGSDTGASTIPTNTWIDCIIVTTPSSRTIYTNGVQYMTSTSTMAPMYGVSLGIPTSYYPSARYQEILVHNVSLSSNQIASVHNYLTNKYRYTP